MGWGSGELASGKQVGYSVEATCEQKGCKEEIDRGLSYACGDMHGEDEVSCDGYFCGEHLLHCTHFATGDGVNLCAACAELNDKAAAERAVELGMSLDNYWEHVETQAKEAYEDETV